MLPLPSFSMTLYLWSNSPKMQNLDRAAIQASLSDGSLQYMASEWPLRWKLRQYL